ncbi:unnamed protein product, partial [Strongylus vulgaris]
ITVIVVVAISLLLALAFGTAALAFCGKNLVAGKRSTRSSTPILAFLSLTLCILITIAGIYCLIQSAMAIGSGYSTVDEDVANSYTSIEEFIINSSSTTLCRFNLKRPELDQRIQYIISNVTRTLNEYRTNFTQGNISSILTFKQKLLGSLQQMENLLEKSPLKRLHELASTIKNVKSTVDDWNPKPNDVADVEEISKVLVAELSNIENYIDAQRMEIKKNMDSYPKHVNKTFKGILKEMQEFKSAATLVQNSNDFTASPIFSNALAFLFIPILQLFIAIFAVVVLVNRCKTKTPTCAKTLNAAGLGAIVVLALLFLLFA